MRILYPVILRSGRSIRMNRVASLLVIAAALIVSGCAAKPGVRQVQPITADLSRYSVLAVVVDTNERTRGKPGYDITARELWREFVANVTASGRFRDVVEQTGLGDSLEARLTITNFNYVSGAARGTIGVLA